MSDCCAPASPCPTISDSASVRRIASFTIPADSSRAEPPPASAGLYHTKQLTEPEVHRRLGGISLGDREGGAAAEAHHSRHEHHQEGLDRGGVLADCAVVVLPGEADLALGRGQLLLQLEDVLVGLQVGVVLDQRDQLAQGAGQEALRLGGLSRSLRSRLLR